MPERLPPPLPRPRRSDLRGSRRFDRRRRLGPSPVRPERRRWPRRLLIAAISLVVVLALAAGGVVAYAWVRFGAIRKTTVAGLTPRKGGEPFDVLLVASGSSAPPGATSSAAEVASAAGPGLQQSDLIVIARVVPAAHQVTLLSIPGNTWVDIPAGKAGVSGPNRIEAALEDGPSLLVSTIERAFELPVTYFAEVDLPGLSALVDAVGGIGLDFAYPVRDARSGLDVTRTGCQLVKGTQALALLRSRHLYYYGNGRWNYDGSSELSSIERQDAFVRAVASKLSGAASDPFALNDLVGAAAHDAEIDRSLSLGALFGLAGLFRGLPASDLRSETLPTTEAVLRASDVLVPAPRPDVRVLNAFLGRPAQSSTASSVTVTTLAGAPSSGAVVSSAGPRPWNPTPCSP